jgi:putative transposase
MIEHGGKLGVTRQCQLLQLPRSTVYHRPRPAATNDLELMRRIDELHLAWPWMGSRSIRDQLVWAGFPVCRDHVRRLMRKMGIHAIYRPPRLVAIMDWHSRMVLSWRLSNTMTADFCVEALDEALLRFGPPEIFNTDQGSQFTGSAFTDRLKDASVRISMDGKGRWLDNVFIERLWRSVKYEEVYLRAYDTVAEARSGLTRYFGLCNSIRTHPALGSRTPDEVYFQTSGLREAA